MLRASETVGMDAARRTRANLVLCKERIDVVAVLQTVMENIRPVASQSGRLLTAKVPDGPIHVNGDHLRLTQVFETLVAYAARYTTRGCGIALSAATRGDEFMVEIRSVVPLPADPVDGKPDPFAQTDWSLREPQKGLHIGLSRVRGTLEVHGGSVDIHGQCPGRGSGYVVRLPILPEPEPLLDAETMRPQRVPVGRRILVAEQTADAAVEMCMTLNAMGHETRTALGALATVLVAEDFHPEVVLLDVDVPRLSSRAAAEHIRLQPWGKEIVLVALTRNCENSVGRRVTAAGFDCHLTRPVEPAALESILARLQPTTD